MTSAMSCKFYSKIIITVEAKDDAPVASTFNNAETKCPFLAEIDTTTTVKEAAQEDIIDLSSVDNKVSEGKITNAYK